MCTPMILLAVMRKFPVAKNCNDIVAVFYCSFPKNCYDITVLDVGAHLLGSKLKAHERPS